MPNTPIQARGRWSFRIGPGGMVYLAIAGLIIAAAMYTQANLLFWAFGLMVGGLIVSLFLPWLMMRNVSITRILPGHGVVGEPLALRYLIKNNKSWIPVFNLVVHEDWSHKRGHVPPQFPIGGHTRRLLGKPHGWVLHVAPMQTAQAESPCWPLHRGWLVFDSIEISTSFPFGVISRKLQVKQQGKVLIYPHLYRIERKMLHRLSEYEQGGKQRVERGGGSEEFLGLRPYRSGDSMRMIDWKRTAKTGQLVSREMTRPSPPKLMLALDLTSLPSTSEEPTAQFQPNAQAQMDEQVERAISLAASVICDAYLQQYQIGLAVHGSPCPVFPLHHSLPHRMRMLEALSLLDTSIRISLPLGMSVRPTVVVVPGHGASNSHGRVLKLGAADMQDFVSEFASGSSSALALNPHQPPPKRYEVGGHSR